MDTAESSAIREKLAYKASMRDQWETDLIRNIKERMPELDELLERCSDFGYEDPIYRFYVESFKVYYIQELIKEIADRLQSLAPHLPLNSWFLEIVKDGTGREFKWQDPAEWAPDTRPIIEAFFHCHYLLSMICKYGKILKEPPSCIPSGWAAVLCLYGIR